MMCQRMGLPPISTIGFGRVSVSSVSRVRRPPQRITTCTRGMLGQGSAAVRRDLPPVVRDLRATGWHAQDLVRIVRLGGAVRDERWRRPEPEKAVPDTGRD